MSSEKPTTREKILNAAWTLLEANPDRTVSMSAIAKAAGISRQALYLHFPTRTDLLVATARYLDEVKNVDARLAASRAAAMGEERLGAFIDAWGGYIPEIYGMAKAFWAQGGEDAAAAAAWRDRMQAVRHGCEAAVKALHADGRLRSGLNRRQATDILWTLLSVRNWEQLTVECGWPQKKYVETVKDLARRALVDAAP